MLSNAPMALALELGCFLSDPAPCAAAAARCCCSLRCMGMKTPVPPFASWPLETTLAMGCQLAPAQVGARMACAPPLRAGPRPASRGSPLCCERPPREPLRERDDR